MKNNFSFLRRTMLIAFLLSIIPTIMYGQNQQISGTVISESDGEALIGVTVLEKGGGSSAVTDLNGKFVIKPKTFPSVLVFSMIGMIPQEVKVTTNTSLNIKLKEDAHSLSQVVVTGYTTQKKADLTGAVSVVSMADVQKQGENNPMKALQGRVPGMNITSDGNPSGSVSIRIRGIGTLNDNSPLYIIDGVPTQSGMHELNGSDIESIQVLKDAASASIYGSRAANGVIIITTKKGQKGVVKINFDASLSVSSYQNRLKMLNTEQYGNAMWQAYVNDGINPNSNGIGYLYNWGYDTNNMPMLNEMTLPKYLDSTHTMEVADTDWFKEITRTSATHQYNLSVSNGGEKGNSFFSAGYYHNDGIIKYSDFQRFSARINTDYKLIGNALTIGENFTLNRTDEVAAPSNIISDAIDMPSVIPVHTLSGGWGGPEGNLPDRNNPARVVYDNRYNRYVYWRLLGNAFVDLKLFKGFNLRSNFGLDYSNKQQRNFTFPYENGYKSSDVSAVSLTQEHWTRWMWNALATYNFEKEKHRGDAMIGVELNNEDYTSFTAYKEGFSILTPDYMWPDAGTGDSQTYGNGDGYSLVSYFGKVNYSYDNKYLVSLTLRNDGSSRFGINNRYAVFPSVSLGWRMSEESFMKAASGVLNDLKIRASWGQTGNQSISNSARYTIYVSNYGATNAYAGGNFGTSYDLAGTNGGGTLASGFKRNQLGNNNIKWEATTQTNLGLDYALFKQALYGSVDVFYKKTTNILTLLTGIATLGEGADKYVNAGSMQNKGFEFNIGYRQKTGSGFDYDINLNLSCYRNKVLGVPETVASAGTYGGNGVESIVGHPIYSQVGYVADGLFKSQEDIINHATQSGAGIGRIRYKDLDNNGVINEKDQTWIYDPTPDFSYGVNMNFGYKNFDLSMFWQGIQGVDVNMQAIKEQTDFWSATNVNYLNKGRRVLNAWTVNNSASDIPALTTTDSNNEKRLSSYYIENGSFLKLRNIQIGYKVPTKFSSEKLKMSSLRFYISGQNLLTVKSKKFSGVDPENPLYGYPIPLNLTFGLNVIF